MYDKGKVIAGLVVFVGFLAVPIWISLAGSSAAPPNKTSTRSMLRICFIEKR